MPNIDLLFFTSHYIFIFLLLLFISFLCTLAGLILTDLFYFLVSKPEIRYRELIIKHIMVQPFFGKLVSLTWIVLFRYGGCYCLCFSISYMCFYFALGCICIYVFYPARYWQLKVFMEEISLFVSICWPLLRSRTLYFGKQGVTWFCWYQSHVVTLWSGGYGDVTATYIRRSEIPSRIYAKHQYMQESE